MSAVLTRAATETVQVEAVTGIDAQGLPAYDSPVAIQARVVRHDTVDPAGTRLGNGDLVQGIATLWVDGAAASLVALHDRVTLADETTGIVGDRIEARTLKGTLDHLTLTLRAVI